MITLDEIANVSFGKASFSGYRTEDVDDFIDAVKESYEQLLNKYIEQRDQNDHLKAENSKLMEKLDVLADSVEKYRSEEDGIKDALISAHKLADEAVRDSRKKADEILADANARAAEIEKSARENAEKTVAEAQKTAEGLSGNIKNDIKLKEEELRQIKDKVADFRSSLMVMYREHLTLIDSLPSQRSTPKEEPKEAAPVSEPEPQPVQEEVPPAAEVSAPAPVQDVTFVQPAPAAPVQQSFIPQYQQPAEPVYQTPNNYTARPEYRGAPSDTVTFIQPDRAAAQHDARYDVLNFSEEQEEDDDATSRFFKRNKKK